MRLTGDYQLSSDIMQESFSRFLARYGPDSPNIALLYTIARNAVFDMVRNKTPTVELTECVAINTMDPEKQALIREEYRSVLAALQSLEESERDMLALAVSSNMTYRDIAAITGTSEGNVKVKIHRARTKLRKILNMGTK